MKSLLIVDDEIYARDYLAKLITKLGFTVYTADTGEQAVKLYAEHRPDYVFLDILLPGIDGEAVFKIIKETDPDANVYFMTGCDGVCSPEKAKELGGRGFFNKPIFVDDIVKFLDELKGGEAVGGTPAV
jgi:DNA-binding NtrC family response regulator